MADDKKTVSIPEWQKAFHKSKDAPSPVENADDQPTTTGAEVLFDQARAFLEDDSIKHEPRDRKLVFLQKKGIHADDIQKLLGNESDSTSLAKEEDEFTVVHDSNAHTDTHVAQESTIPRQSSQKPEPTETSSLARTNVRPDIPPIITYPEFLLKPQKPPPLVTIERLTNAAYALAGLSALTYGASKYLVQPMLEALTEARHELADSTIQDLHALNTKLETSVSHVPYIASSAVLNRKDLGADHSDLDSVDSDPTELFHRDIATQTTPPRSRSSSVSSFTNLSAQDPTTQQSDRLGSLYTTLQSLLSSTNTRFSETQLKDSISDFQSSLDKLESTHSPFSTGYNSIYSTAASDEKSTAAGGSRKKGSYGSGGEGNEAAKFKSEIRGLKGAFLSSRNFPTARPAVPFTTPTR